MIFLLGKAVICQAKGMLFLRVSGRTYCTVSLMCEADYYSIIVRLGCADEQLFAKLESQQ